MEALSPAGSVLGLAVSERSHREPRDWVVVLVGSERERIDTLVTDISTQRQGVEPKDIKHRGSCQ